MIQYRRGFGLTLESAEEKLILRKPVGQHFHRDLARQPGLDGLIHRSHTTFANFLLQFISTQRAHTDRRVFGHTVFCLTGGTFDAASGCIVRAYQFGFAAFI